MKKIIGIIGCGNMGRAIYERLKSFYVLSVFDKDSNKTKNLAEKNVAGSIVGLLNKSDAVILAVKPRDFSELLEEIKNYAKERLIISIAAGITTSYIEKQLGDIRVVRVMPNMPARIGKGMSCLCKGKFATKEDLNFAKQLFDNLGKTLVINENMMDAATAVSGSGPGYFYDWAEGKDIKEIKNYATTFATTLTATAESIGFVHQKAKILAETTCDGSIAYLEKTKLLPSEAKKQITSKGGTTEAGLEVLHNGGSLKEAVKAALKRAKELSRR